MTSDKYHIILFDGYCNLCSGLVRFIIKHDPKKIFKFAPLQSEIGNSLLAQRNISAKDFDSIILIKEGQHHLKSTAALLIAKELNNLWPLCTVFLIIPPFIRDFIYDLVAKSRYRIFGQRDVCRVAEDGELGRFL